MNELVARTFCGLVGLDRKEADLLCAEMLGLIGYIVAHNAVLSLGPGSFSVGFVVIFMAGYAALARFVMIPLARGLGISESRVGERDPDRRALRRAVRADFPRVPLLDGG